jgi:AMP deaminase
MVRTFEHFRRCIGLRDKYIARSLQRLGDNPRDHDGNFKGIAEGFADVSGVKPNVDLTSARALESLYEPWKIYPKPPPPHWHFSPKKDVFTADGHVTPGDEEFDFSTCQIPGPQSWEFEIDSKGVYQVYLTAAGACRFVLLSIHLTIYLKPQINSRSLRFRLSGNTSLISTTFLRSYLTAPPKA